MCRLLAFTSLERKSFYDVVGADFEKFVALSAEHKDGWGIGHDGEVIKDINPAKESSLLTETGKNLETAGALFHLRSGEFSGSFTCAVGNFQGGWNTGQHEGLRGT